MTRLFPNTRLTDFLARIDARADGDLADAFVTEILETGGTWVQPADGDTWSSHMFEIALHGVAAFGGTAYDAMLNWLRAARAVAPQIEDDGFITLHPHLPFPHPRNHGEEIANARAAHDPAARL